MDFLLLLRGQPTDQSAHLQVIEEESGVSQVEDHLLHPQTKGHSLWGVLMDAGVSY